MDLFDRYVQAVKKHLPRATREDIAEELAVNLQAQIDDREAQSGRPLTENELADMLKHHGHPRLVAARYRPRQHLIGPVAFPFYWMTLRLALSFAALIYAIVSAVLIAQQPITAAAVVEAVLRFPGVALGVFAWVTLVFAVLDYGWERFVTASGWLQSWDPRTLPAVERDSAPSQFGLLFDFLGSLLLTTWLVAAAYFPAAAFGLGTMAIEQSPVHVAPALRALYWPVVAALMVQTLVKGAVLVSGARASFRLAAGFAFKAIAMVVLILLLGAGTYVAAASGAADPAGAAWLAETLNTSIAFSLRLAVLVVGVDMLWSAVRARRAPARRKTDASARARH